MKRPLLKLLLIALVSAFSSQLFAGEGPSVFTSVTYSVDGNVLTEGDDVVIGSTINYVAQVTIPDDGNTYELDFWPLGPKNGDENPVGWLGAAGWQSVSNTITEFSGSFTFTGSQDAGAGVLRMAQRVNGVAPAIWTDAIDFSINWVESSVTVLAINSVEYRYGDVNGVTINSGENIEIGSDIYYNINVDVPDDGNTYEIILMHKATINGTNYLWPQFHKIESIGIGTSLELTGVATTLASNGAGDPFIADPGGIIRLRLRDVVNTSTYKDNDFAFAWSATVTGINNNELNFGLYPNPAKSVVNVVIEDVSNISIFNVSGSEVKTVNQVSGQVTIPVSDLAKGIYFVKVTEGSSSSIRKILVE